MKIAVVTDDGVIISQHFGRAQQYVVLITKDGKVESREMRLKKGHRQLGCDAPLHEHECGRHGYEQGAHIKHAKMVETIADCQVLLAGGMGWGAYESVKQYNIEPIVTDVENIEEAVRLYSEDKLPNLMERLH